MSEFYPNKKFIFTSHHKSEYIIKYFNNLLE